MANITGFDQGNIHLKQNLKDLRKVLDPVHNFIAFELKIWKFIDTPQFQRLRDIKQLGATYFVFPGATHSRYQHSLGTAYLSLLYIQCLIKNHPQLYPPQNKESIQQSKFLVTLAGLMHDLGHGPFSHMFDNKLIKSQWTDKNKPWRHEDASIYLFRYLIKQNNLQNLINCDQINRVERLILGQKLKDDIKPWQFQIVSNKETGLDVDKFDYFKRDSFYLGAKNTIVQYELLMSQTKIIDNRLCYPTKYADKIYDIYFNRYKLFKNFYLNRITQGIQMMICDVFSIMSKKLPQYNFLKICQKIEINPQQYLKLTDSLISQVERSKSAQLAEARQIIRKIRKREIYRFVIETHTFTSSQKHESSSIFGLDEQEIQKKVIKQARLKGMSLDKKQIIVAKGNINYGYKDKNPLDLVKFYNKNISPFKICQSTKQQLSLLSTPRYSESYIRLYIKNSSQQQFLAASQAFKQICAELNAKVSVQSTPRNTPIKMSASHRPGISQLENQFGKYKTEQGTGKYKQPQL